jgi:hypothetical protein
MEQCICISIEENILLYSVSHRTVDEKGCCGNIRQASASIEKKDEVAIHPEKCA